MVTQATQDFIFAVVDANNEYDTKLFLFFMFGVFLIFNLWWANRIIPMRANLEQRSTFPIYQQISVKLMRVSSVLFLIFMPLTFSIMMYRTYTLDNITTFLIIGYGVVTIIGVGIWFLFGMHWVQELLALIGIDTGSKQGTIIRRKSR